MIASHRAYWGRKVKFLCPNQEVLTHLDNILPPLADHSHRPPGNRGAIDDQYDCILQIRYHKEGYALFVNGEEITRSPHLPSLLKRLEREFQRDIGKSAPDGVFVHSGVVVWKGQALVLPASSLSGKSTMVRALTKLGATYYSDEFAIIDSQGWVHPHRRAMTIRRYTKEDLRVFVDHSEPVTPSKCRISLVVDCEYRKGAPWKPEPISQGEGVLALFSNTVSAQLSPQRDLAHLSLAMRNAVAYRGLRGDVRHAAPRLLRLLQETIEAQGGTLTATPID